MSDIVNALVQEGIRQVSEWAAKTRPLLSEPPEGMEWRVVILPFDEKDLDPETGQLKMRYEWVLVELPSAS